MPLVVWAIHETPITVMDVAKAVFPSVLSVGAGAFLVVATHRFTQSIDRTFVRLVAESLALFGGYWFVLLFVFGQRRTYMKIVGELKFRTARADSSPTAELIEQTSI